MRDQVVVPGVNGEGSRQSGLVSEDRTKQTPTGGYLPGHAHNRLQEQPLCGA
jgi:hypothetical protein